MHRDEEKKMGTLVKEDFGRPDRANTMVSPSFGSFCWQYNLLFKLLELKMELFYRACGMVRMIN